MTTPEARIVSVLEKHGPLTTQVIATLTGYPMGVVVPELERMERDKILFVAPVGDPPRVTWGLK